MDTQPNNKPAVAMTCGNCFFHVRAKAGQAKQPEEVKCTIRPPARIRQSLAQTYALARCPYWTDAETLAQPLRRLAPPETTGAKAEGGAT